MVPDVMERTPAFVDAVPQGSAADTAGLVVDDLILMVGPDRVASQEDVRDRLRRIDRRDDVPLTVQRGTQIVPVTLRLSAGAATAETTPTGIAQ